MPARQTREVPGRDRYKVDSFIKDRMRELEIDKDALDNELIGIGQIFQKVGEEIAYATSRRDQAKDELALVMADLDMIVRQDMAQENVKVTESAVKRAMLKHPDAQGATNRLRLREEELMRLQALEKSFTQRSYAIRELVSLHLAAYFGTTANVVRHDINKEGQERRYNDIRRKQHVQRTAHRGE
jgi:hypothetical protein